MNTDLYIRKYFIVPKFKLTAICLTTTKTSVLDVKTSGDTGTNTSTGNLFHCLIPFSVYSRYPLCTLNLSWFSIALLQLSLLGEIDI